MGRSTAWTKWVHFFAIVATIFVYTLMVSTEASASDVIQPVGAKAQTGGGSLNTTTGLEFPVGEQGTNVTLTSKAANEYWPNGFSVPGQWVDEAVQQNSVGFPKWIAWDLGAEYKIGSFHLWNGNVQNSCWVGAADIYQISGATYDALVDNGVYWNASAFNTANGTLAGSYSGMAGGPGPYSPVNDGNASDNSPSAYNYAGDNYNLISPTTGRYFLMNILQVASITPPDNNLYPPNPVTGQVTQPGSFGAAMINEIRFVKALPMGVCGPGGNSITNGDVTPIVADGTDFAGVILGASLTHTFTITNTSAADINLTGAQLVAVAGDMSFSVAVQPVTPVAAGSTTTFQITFSATAPAGVKTATVSITNDTPATPYSFNIRGTATSVPPPTKLAYTAVPSTGTSGIPFSVTVQAQDTAGNPSCPVSATTITLTNVTGAGFMSGVLTGVIDTYTNSVTIASPIYSKADVMTLRAAATAGDSLTNVTSSGITFSAGAAAKLEFTTQPGGGTAETAWAIQPVVQVQDVNGNAVTTDVSSVTVAILSNAGGGTLSGTLTKAAVAGMANFSANGLKINKSGIGYTLIARDGSLASATSSVFNITAGAVDAGSSTVSASPTQVQGDGIVAATITVTLRDISGNPVEGKNVTLASGRGVLDMITTNSGTTSDSGTAIFSVRSLTLGVTDFTAIDETDALPISPSKATVGFVPVTVIKPTSAKARLSNNVPYDGPIQTYTGLEFLPGEQGANVTLTSLALNEANITGPGYGPPTASWLYPAVPTVSAPAWIAWDLGVTNTIDAFHLWNGNNQGDRYVRAANMYAVDAATYGALVDNGDAAFDTGSGTLVGSYSNMTTGPGPFSPLNTGGPYPLGSYNYAGTNYNLSTPTSGRYFLMNITAAGINSNNVAAINEIRFTKLSSIFVAGTNNVVIAFADMTPSIADGTDFGGIVLYTSLTHTFTIGNTSQDQINLTGDPMVLMTGSADFSVTAQPADNVGSNGSTTFQITFSPNGAAGQIKTATVSIYNDSILSPYTFSIRGTAVGGTVLLIR